VKKKRERASPRSATLKVCQGVPVPDGYVVVGYVTSSVCPHGAYVLKRQETEVSGAKATGRTEAEIQQRAVSRPRRVNIIGDSDAPLPATTGSRQPTLAGTTPTSVPLNASPASVPAPVAEEVGAGDVVRINTTLVTVPVSVLDRQGRFVPGLQREDFHVFENGVEQPIAYFEPTEKPFTVALLLDTSASTRFHLWEIKEAAIAFAKQLRPQDRVLVLTFDDEVLLLTEATNDQDVINTVIQMNANTGSSTRLYDAVDLVINERLNKIQGRKAVVLFTDGVDTSSYIATYQSTLRETEELDALIYPIQYDTSDYVRTMNGAGSVTIVTSRNNWPFPGRSSSRVIYGAPSSGSPLPGSTRADYQRAGQYLQGMADRTGGRLYKANDSTQLAQAFSSIAEELRRQYSLGYYPPSGAVEAEERRTINVRVHRPDLAVRSRNSYMRRPSANAIR
jgi:VWFA-related protein